MAAAHHCGPCQQLWYTTTAAVPPSSRFGSLVTGFGLLKTKSSASMVAAICGIVRTRRDVVVTLVVGRRDHGGMDGDDQLVFVAIAQ